MEQQSHDLVSVNIAGAFSNSDHELTLLPIRCAGICQYERGGGCRIKLSEPLLKVCSTSKRHSHVSAATALCITLQGPCAVSPQPRAEGNPASRDDTRLDVLRKDQGSRGSWATLSRAHELH